MAATATATATAPIDLAPPRKSAFPNLFSFCMPKAPAQDIEDDNDRSGDSGALQKDADERCDTELIREGSNDGVARDDHAPVTQTKKEVPSEPKQDECSDIDSATATATESSDTDAIDDVLGDAQVPSPAPIDGKAGTGTAIVKPVNAAELTVRFVTMLVAFVAFQAMKLIND